MISEGSCDTEYWSNDAEYSALLSQKKNGKNVSQYHHFTVFLWLHKYSLGEHMKNVFKNIFKNLTDPKPFRQSPSAITDRQIYT